MKKLSSVEEGVSPIIGTILLVAMTVVLASTLLLYVYLTPSATQEPMIRGTFYSVNKLSDGTYKLVFSKFNIDPRITELQGIIQINNSASYTFTFVNGYDRERATISPEDSTIGNLEITYYDLANNTIVNSGDYLIIRNLKENTRYDIMFVSPRGDVAVSTTIQT